jgi:hypothetical protein
MNFRLWYYVAIAVMIPSAASAMPVSMFLPRVEALQKKGPMALFSKDLGESRPWRNSLGTACRQDRWTACRILSSLGGRQVHRQGYYIRDAGCTGPATSFYIYEKRFEGASHSPLPLPISA